MARPLALGLGVEATTLYAACPSSSPVSHETGGGNCLTFKFRGLACSCSYLSSPQQQKRQLRRRQNTCGQCCAYDGRRESPLMGSVLWQSLLGRVTSRGFGECQTSSSSSYSSVITPSASSRAMLPLPPSSSPPHPREAPSVTNSILCEVEDADHSEIERKLLKALQERRTEDAWGLHKTMRRRGALPSEVCLSRLVAQLSHVGTPHSLSRAQKVLVDLQKMNQVGLLDEDSMGILVMASARSGAARYACSILRVMLEMGMCPPVKVWSVVVSRLGKHAYDAPLALKLFDEICSYLHGEFRPSESSSSSRSSSAEDNTGAADVAIDETKTGKLGASSNREETSVTKRIVDNSAEGGNVISQASYMAGDIGINFGTRRSSLMSSRWMNVKVDTAAFNAVLNACATLGLVKEADDFLARMASLGVKADRLTFNILIKLCANAQDGDQLQLILREMIKTGVEPDLSTCNSLVAAYVNLGKLDEAERVVRSMQQGEAGSVHPQLEPGFPRERTESNIVDIPGSSGGGAKGMGMPEVLRGVVRQNSRRAQETGREGPAADSGDHGENQQQHQHLKPFWICKVKPDVRTYTTLMKGYVKSSRLKDAVQLLVAMQNKGDSGIQPNEVTYTTVIGACIDMGLMDEAKSVLLEMAAQRVPANVVTYNVLLKGYCNAGQVATAYEVMEDMRKAEISPDSVSYNTLINGCIRRGDNVGAYEVFREMRGANICPTEISYTTLMNAFARNGQHKLVAEVFNEMRSQVWMRVDVIAWNVLIDGYCKAGQMDEAKQAFAEMKAEGLHPSVATYGSLVKGFQNVDKPGEVLVLWKEIKERTEAKKGDSVEPLEPDGGLLDYLVDTCLRAGFFQRALEVVACMEGQGILADKTKYKRMFIDLYSTLYTSKHASAKRRAKSAERRSAVDAFKFWLGLPNQYYQTDWEP